MDLNSLFSKKIFTVYELTSYISTLLDEYVGYVFIRGEVSNLKISDAGHAYFTIKDSKSQISAVLFKGQNIKISFRDGSKVVVGGVITVYPPRGIYQIVVNEVILDGQGELYLHFEELKKRLFEKGLFSEEVKKPLPDFPFHIGVITSPYGAAIRDFLKIAFTKNPFIKVSIYPTKVQGEGASEMVISGVRYFNQVGNVDVIVIIRGGGSFEDLFCFNDEGLAYAIRESNIPVVTGIGHEIDFTIADYVADRRAATPTAAAELVVKGFADILDMLRDYKDRLDESIKGCVLNRERVIKRFLQVFYRDKDRFDKREELINRFVGRIESAMRGLLSNRYDRINRCAALLERNSPIGNIRRYLERVGALNLRMKGAILNSIDFRDNRLKNNIIRLELLNPENILKKGYSIVYKEGMIIDDSEKLSYEDLIKIRFYKGSVAAIVKDK